MTRTRTRTPVYSSDVTYSKYEYSPAGTCFADAPALGAPTTGTTGSFYCSSEIETMTDVVTPNFEKLKSEGKIVNNPMSKYYQILKNDAFKHRLDWGVDMNLACNPTKWVYYRNYRLNKSVAMSSYHDTNLKSDIFETSDVDRVIDRVVTKAFANIGHDKVLLLAFVAEFGKTLSGITWALRKAHRILKHVRWAELKHVAKELTFSELQDVYMNARYNLRPLYYDIKGMIEAFSYMNADFNPRQTFRSKDFLENEVTSTTTSSLYTTTLFSVAATFLHTAKTNYTIRAGVLTLAEPATISQVLGLDRGLETLWELVKFSFIIDWFLNVGDTIASWTPNAGFRVLASWVTVDKTELRTTSFQGISIKENTLNGQRLHNSVQSNISGSNYTIFTRTFERRVSPSLPIIPRWNINLDAAKLLDLAIITKKIRKSRVFHGIRV